MKRYLLWVSFLSVVIYTGQALAAGTLVSTNQAVKNLASTINTVKTKTTLAVVFPTVVPQSKTPYYASYWMGRGQRYTLNIDTSAACHGAHYCNTGSLAAVENGKPHMYAAKNHQILTVPVNLANHTKGFYTPGHAMGDYWPPMLEWQQGSVLYRLTWNDASSKDLMSMANTVIEANKK